MNHRNLLLLAVVSCLIFFIGLGGVPLLDPDEPVYAQTPKEMLAAHDLLSPRIYGDYWYDKPPMYYWLVAGSFSLFGVNEFAARFPSAVMGLGCVFYLFFAVRRLLNETAAFWSAMVLATSLGFFYIAKAAVTDMTLNLFLMVAFSFVLFYHRTAKCVNGCAQKQVLKGFWYLSPNFGYSTQNPGQAAK